MTLESAVLGAGGTGFQGTGSGSAAGAIKELQGLSIELLAGANADTKIAVAAIRSEDTILSCLEQDGTSGLLTDRTANTTISSIKATGTLSCVSVAEDDTFTVNGVTFTVKDTANLTSAYTTVETGGTDTAMALNIVAAINSYFSVPGTTKPVVATSAVGVVTVTATVDGPGSGPIVTDTGTTITISNTDAGGVTATCVSVAEDDALIVNGVTFTVKDAPSGELQVDTGATDTIMATNFVTAVNAYQTSYNSLDVVATSAAGVVTLAAISGRTGNSVTLTETGSTITASGAYLTGGTNTGGISCSDATSGDKIILVWFNKA